MIDNKDENIVIYHTQDIQNIFNCGKNQAYALMHTPGFPLIQINKKLMVEKNALQKWLKNNKGEIVVTI